MLAQKTEKARLPTLNLEAELSSRRTGASVHGIDSPLVFVFTFPSEVEALQNSKKPTL